MLSFSSLFPFILLFFSFSLVLSSNKLDTYIIQVQPSANANFALGEDVRVWHESFLPKSASGESRLIHSYTEVFNGFAAKLNKDELASISNKPGFVRAYPDRVLQLLTTHTPQFLGLTPGGGLWSSSNQGEGIIIGLLDTGIAATHPSFSDEGMPPPPKKWKGSCAFDNGCNNKLIGAKSLVEEDSQGPPVDDVGHGTHTSSTAAGNFVADAMAFGLGAGTASGMAPRAHVAMYKVCNMNGCSTAAILAGIDAAVNDGVDILSLSIGGGSLPFTDDVIAIGAFAAIQKGVVISCAGGNSGPQPSTLGNEAPWIITVAASTVDRSFRSTVVLGDGSSYDGETLNQIEDGSSSMSFPLAYFPDFSACLDFSSVSIKGKIVLCSFTTVSSDSIAKAVKQGGGIGVILFNPPTTGFTINDQPINIRASTLPSAFQNNITTYALSKNPTASIVFNGTVLGVSPAPVVAYFSSRGPNRASPGILKPDISAPGLNVLAAWPAQVAPGNSGAKTFNILSGTSMATPHISGIAALLKSVHPDWSPAAIKSAIMTTSNPSVLDEQHNKAPFFVMGAGHINPTKAADPGLVYDIGFDDYIGYICGLYGDKGISTIVRSQNVSCSQVASISEAQLNYPSIVVAPAAKPVTVSRTVTNVGKANSIYKVELDVPDKVSVTVTPSELQFSSVKEKMTFKVTVSWKGASSGSVDGNLRWVSPEHVVRSPIAIVGA